MRGRAWLISLFILAAASSALLLLFAQLGDTDTVRYQSQLAEDVFRAQVCFQGANGRYGSLREISVKALDEWEHYSDSLVIELIAHQGTFELKIHRRRWLLEGTVSLFLDQSGVVRRNEAPWGANGDSAIYFHVQTGDLSCQGQH
jgi:hypothetical protein